MVIHQLELRAFDKVWRKHPKKIQSMQKALQKWCGKILRG